MGWNTVRQTARPARLRPARAIVGGVVAAGLLGSIAGPAAAQGAPGQPPSQTADAPGAAGTQEAPLPVPAALITRLLAGGADARLVLNQWLNSEGRPPEEVARRATALIEALGAQKDKAPPQDLLKAIDTVAAHVARRLATTPVIQMAVEPGYRPPPKAVALKFGPPDAPPVPGFEAVLPKDPRITGGEVQGLRRPLEEPLVGSGILGVEKINVKVPPGQYRVILLTQNLGDPNLVRRPFGYSLRINGVPVVVGSADPNQWLPGGAVLSSQPARPADGFATADLPPQTRGLIVRQQAGGIVIEARAPDGRLTIEMGGFGRQGRSYLTALVAEPVDQPSSLILSREARQAIIGQDRRLELESRVLAAAASLVERIAPAEGPERLLSLPQPEFESTEVVSSS